MMATIGTRLDEARKTAGFKSQSALARASGVPQPTVHRILSQASHGVALRTLQALAAACNVQLEWLISGNSYLPSNGLIAQGVHQLDKPTAASEGGSAEFDEHADELNRLAGYAACLLAILSSDQVVPREVRIHVLIQAGNYAEDIGKGLATLMRLEAA